MSTVEKSIRLCAWKTNYQTFQVVQGEANSRKFNIQLFSTTIPVDLTNCEVMFYAVKPDSTKVYVECEVIDAENGLASVTLTDQMCVVDGTVDCWVQVIGEGGTDLRFEGMNIEVSPCSMTMSLESSDDMRAFLQQSAKLGALETEVKNARAGEDSLRAKQDAQDKTLSDTASAIRQELGVERTRIDNIVAPGVSAIGFCKKRLFKQSTTKVNTTYYASWTSDGQDDDSVFLSSAKTKNLFVLDCFAVGGIEASDSWERTTHRAEAEITIIEDSVRVQAFYSSEDPEQTAARFYVILGYDEDNAELTDIRVGANGTVYPSAGEAVRVQANALDEAKVNKTDIVQTAGDSETSVMSQKAVTEEVNALKSDLSQLSEEIANLSSSGSGLSQTLRVAIYNLLMDAAYQSSGHETDKAALEELLTGSSGGGESGGEGEEVIYYTIEKTLTNVSISNGAVSVAAGSAYSATLTADEGYTLDSVTVTMGGEAVLVTDGIISIASVTGNIVITATATNEESGNDPFAGTWTEGFRLQSNGTEYATGHPTYDTTDYVDCTNFSTVTISTTEALNLLINAVVWYDDSKTYISGEGGKYVSTSNEKYSSSLSFTKVDGAAYCRICLAEYEHFNISVE